MGFIIVGILLNMTPGSDTMYILTRSIAQGRKAGMVSVLGIISGCMVHTLSAALGLSLILTTSATVFMVVKYAGAGYLIYLGIRAFFDRSPVLESRHTVIGRSDLMVIYRQGVLTNVLNPKVALFFLSFLPQFVRPESVSGPVPFLILGCTFMATGLLWSLFLAYCASAMTQTLRNNEMIGKALQKISGTVFVGLGLQLALKRD